MAQIRYLVSVWVLGFFETLLGLRGNISVGEHDFQQTNPETKQLLFPVWFNICRADAETLHRNVMKMKPNSAQINKMKGEKTKSLQ